MPFELDQLAPPIRDACRHSRFLVRQLDARPWLAAQLATHLEHPLGGPEMQAWLARRREEGVPLDACLRKLRAWVLCHLLVRDLSGRAQLAEVVESMSALADTAVHAALPELAAGLEPRYGKPRSAKGEEQQLMVIGMGKLGGRELNVSSDVDFIFVFPDDGQTDGTRSISNFEYFTKLGQGLIRMLDEITSEGRVFRVDMRLRPNGDSGPLVCSLDMLEDYLITQGREWERYAWIKARLMTAGPAQALEAVTRPFVFRKYLDFGAINAMRDLHAQIRREVTRRDMVDHIKLGPGGIREIEFIAQVFQLIRGGRDLGLQIKPTLRVLERLGERGLLPPEAVTELGAAYDFLRRLEHRLQYLDDAQTHLLPSDEDDRQRIAEAMGFDDYQKLLVALNRHRGRVSERFEWAFDDPTDAGHPLDDTWSACDDVENCEAALARLGFANAAEGAVQLAELRASARYRQMPPGIRARFDGVMPRVLEAAAETPHPDQTLARMLDLLTAISRRAAYLALLQQYPQALRHIARLVSSSNWAASYLTRHPILLDELLDARQLGESPDWEAFRSELAQSMASTAEDMERQMDLMRERHHSQIFRLLTQDLEGKLSVEILADHLSALADSILDATIPLCWSRLRKRHCDQPAFAIVSYGKHGGKELGYSSDLDLVFLFDDPSPDAAEVYARLGQRIVSWLSNRTAAGLLYETDLRLRPNGDSGLLVTSLEGFRQYQLASAWTWEHQALTRARFSAGDPRLARAFADIREEVLRLPRELDKLRSEVIEMRQRMYSAHGGKGPQFDLKHDYGGLVDVEFLVQFLVLGHARKHPELTANRGNIALLGLAAELGLIDPLLAPRAADAYRSLRRHQHRLRLDGGSSALPAAMVKSELLAVRRMWVQVFGDNGHH